MDLYELGECTDSVYDKEHLCKQNEFPKFDRIVHCVENHEQAFDAWQLHGIHYADQEEVDMGEAEEVGEITYHSVIVINYCPFCGADLSKT